MIKEFRKYDRESQRTAYIKTEKFNALLAGAGAAVRVIPYEAELRSQYGAYLQNCEAAGKEPLTEHEYGREYAHFACSFEVCENAPAGLLISRALDVKAVKVKYAEDWYGRVMDDVLEVSYRMA